MSEYYVSDVQLDNFFQTYELEIVDYESSATIHNNYTWSASYSDSSYGWVVFKLTTGLSLGNGELLVTVYCHEVSPSDRTGMKIMGSEGAIMGTDYDGTPPPDQYYSPQLSANTSGQGIGAGSTVTLDGSDNTTFGSPGYWVMMNGYKNSGKWEIKKIEWEPSIPGDPTVTIWDQDAVAGYGVSCVQLGTLPDSVIGTNAVRMA